MVEVVLRIGLPDEVMDLLRRGVVALERLACVPLPMKPSPPVAGMTN